MLFGASSHFALAKIVNATDCTQAAVQAAINAAASGDTVVVPAGSATWPNVVTISGKALTLQGAGIDVTRIIDQSADYHALTVICTAATFVRVTGFTFVNGVTHTDGIVYLGGPSANGNYEVGFRFDHNKLVFPVTGGRGIETNGIFGVIDHNSLVVQAAGSQQSVSVWGSSDSTDGGFTPWTWPLTLGTANAVFIEDNVFDYTLNNQDEDSIDAYGGARLVVRHNTFLSISQGFHGTDSGNRRSTHSFEIYNNTYTNNSTTSLRYLTVRGGTGVIFNNTYNGTGAWNGVTLQYYRLSPTLDKSAWGMCDGTLWKLGSTSLSADASRACSTTGTVGFSNVNNEALGTFGGSFTNGFDGTGPSGYPGRDMPGYTTGQVLSPIYTWNNGTAPIGTFAGGLAADEAAIAAFIKPNRDFIVGTKPGYTSYTYPHPLVGGSVAPGSGQVSILVK